MEKYLAVMIIVSLLAACGVEMVATTATVGTMEAQNAKTAINNGNVAKNIVDKVAVQRAVDTYLAEKGAYPQSLAELVPDFLPIMPKKADGTPFGYDSSTGKVLDTPAAGAVVGAIPNIALPKTQAEPEM